MLWGVLMLDPALCSRPVSAWTMFTQRLFHWGSTLDYKVVLTGLVLVLVIWGMRQRGRRQKLTHKFRWKQPLIKGTIALVVLALIATFPPVVTLANYLLVSPLPQDTGARVDAIVVLGRGPISGDRAAVAAELWQAGRAPKVFVSGRGDAPYLVKELRKYGVSASALASEDCSQTTEENAQFTARLLQPQGVQHILLITDSPHMLRSWMTFERVGFQVIPHGNALPHWLSHRKHALTVYREYAGLISYTLQGRIQPFRIRLDPTDSYGQPPALPFTAKSD
uniref:DUF218 domain-containing protein n=1 Tax=Cyanothece sp. (strain PCC 7425 / ATCC 29141) TaxID=395961 RepID=B8HK85_CYAP4